MPVYEYACSACGEFSETRLMFMSGAPAPCPTCGVQSPRVLSATAISARGRGGSRRKVGRTDFPEPKLVKSDREPPKPKMTSTHHHGDRPWMIGH